MRQVFPYFYSILSLAAFSCLCSAAAIAQVTADGTTATTVNQVENSYTIEQGDRIGDNLFHSFDEFSVPTLGSAIFNNANDIANIFSRVTGSNISNIDGILGANGTANLYLINPNGVIFGENAQLNLGGSFFASTADSFLFGENVEFSASNPAAKPLLDVSIPIGINFRNNPADIVNRSRVQNNAGDIVGLEVEQDNNLTLVGGNINFEAGNITARGGGIELGGLSAEGIVEIKNDGSLSFPENVDKANIILSNADVNASTSVNGNAGNITITTNSLSLSNADVKASTTVNGNAGSITITTDSLSLTNGAEVAASTFGQGNAGSIEITANNITINPVNQQPSANPTGILAQVGSENLNAVGNAGNINIKTGSLSITNGGIVTVSNLDQGDAGNITITTDSLSLSNNANVQANTSVKGDAGNIIITSDYLSLSNNANVQANTNVKGDAGNIIITSDYLSLSNSDVQASTFNTSSTTVKGDAGNIIIITGSLSLNSGAEVAASSFGIGNAGSIKITADNITIDSSDSVDSINPTGVLAQVGSENSNAEGNAGNITINTGSLDLKHGGVISAINFSAKMPKTLESSTIYINARDTIIIDGEIPPPDELTFRPSGIITQVGSSENSNAVGNAGDIIIKTGSLYLENGGVVASSTFANGDAGSITITAADEISIDGQAPSSDSNNDRPSGINSEVVSSNLFEPDAGDINITIDYGSLFLRNGGVISTKAFEQGRGGDITIKADFIIAYPSQDTGSDIVAFATNQEGGKIEITAKSLFNIQERNARQSDQPSERENNGTNDIDASSTFDQNGEITLNTPEIDPTSGLIELPEAVGDASDEISQNPCEQGVRSEFTVTGKGGLPSNPNETLNGNRVRVGLVDPVLSQQEEELNLGANSISPEKLNPAFVPAQGWVFNDQGEVMLTSYNTTDTEIRQSRQHNPLTCSSGL